MWGPPVSPFPISLFLSASSPVTHGVGRKEVTPVPMAATPTVLAHPDVCHVAAGTNAKVCPPSIHLPGTLAPPYKWNPHAHLPVHATPWGIFPNAP
jgi:hypothetical protein